MLLYLQSHNNGELAQLVERLHGMQEVSGSNPLFSTKKNQAHINLKWNAYKRLINKEPLNGS